jgi:hypothetical protein
MRFARYSDAEIKHRSDLATKLKYGAKQPQAPAAEAARATNVAFPNGLAPVPVTISPKPEDSLPKADVIAMMDTAAESEAMADVVTPSHPRNTWRLLTTLRQRSTNPGTADLGVIRECGAPFCPRRWKRAAVLPV